MPRFVILRHELPAASHRVDHWDFMLEEPAHLATWAMEEMFCQGRHVTATRLSDHRKTYLEYEGPISGNRGNVTRWDWGDYQTIQRDETTWIVQLVGQRSQGRVVLLKDEADAQRWLMSLLKI